MSSNVDVYKFLAFCIIILGPDFSADTPYAAKVERKA